jgi:hypothetical protein
MKNDLGRQSLPEVVHFFTFPARGGTDFQSHLRASASGARAARPASARICVEVLFRCCSSGPWQTTATSSINVVRPGTATAKTTALHGVDTARHGVKPEKATAN